MIRGTGGALTSIVDFKLGNLLAQTDFQWVLESSGYYTCTSKGVYMSHIRGNNGEVVRVLDFIDSMYDCDTSNGRGLY